MVNHYRWRDREQKEIEWRGWMSEIVVWHLSDLSEIKFKILRNSISSANHIFSISFIISWWFFGNLSWVFGTLRDHHWSWLYWLNCRINNSSLQKPHFQVQQLCGYFFCVFWPVNGCSARHLLVEIHNNYFNFLMLSN